LPVIVGYDNQPFVRCKPEALVSRCLIIRVWYAGQFTPNDFLYNVSEIFVTGGASQIDVAMKGDLLQ
jgi:hypothetical protein